jgi:AcrR family transcriptional regulator
MGEAAISQAPSHFLQWVRPPQQERTRLSLTRMLDAAEALIAAKGIEEAGIVEIARQAGTSVGGFYRRFRDKDTLLQALHERFCEEASLTAADALEPGRWTGATLVEIVHEFAAFLVQIYREREGFFRAILTRGPADTIMRERTNRLFDDMSARLHVLLENHREEIRHPDPALATRFALHAMCGTLNHIVQVQPPALRLDDPRLAEELARAFVAYVRDAGAPTRSHSRPRRMSP